MISKHSEGRMEYRLIIYENLDSSSPTFGAICTGNQGLQKSNKRNETNTDWIWQPYDPRYLFPYPKELTEDDLIKILGNDRKHQKSTKQISDSRREHQERLKKVAQQMLDICQANDCTIFDVRVAVDKLMKMIDNTKV